MKDNTGGGYLMYKQLLCNKMRMTAIMMITIGMMIETNVVMMTMAMMAWVQT